MATDNIVENLIMMSKQMLVDEYKHPETRGWHWDMMKGWLVDDEGELTRRGRAIIAEVEAWEAEHVEHGSGILEEILGDSGKGKEKDRDTDIEEDKEAE